MTLCYFDMYQDDFTVDLTTVVCVKDGYCLYEVTYWSAIRYKDNCSNVWHLSDSTKDSPSNKDSILWTLPTWGIHSTEHFLLIELHKQRKYC